MRSQWLLDRGKSLTERGIAPEKVSRILDSALYGERPVLESDFEILTDHHGILTVGEILTDRAKYHGETCHEPVDWESGKNKAKIFSNNDGRTTIHSFAHGGTTVSVWRTHVDSRFAMWFAGEKLLTEVPRHQRVEIVALGRG